MAEKNGILLRIADAGDFDAERRMTDCFETAARSNAAIIKDLNIVLNVIRQRETIEERCHG